MKRTHNAWTTAEVATLAKHWPTLMPMEELLALIPRHSENSITSYANKRLKITRPTCRSASGSPRAQPAWERVVALLETRPHSQIEIAEALGFSRARASEILRAHRAEVYVESWRWPSAASRAEALWALGGKSDALEPMGAQRQRWIGVRRNGNPFLTAAGLIAAPSGQTGRVYQQHD